MKYIITILMMFVNVLGNSQSIEGEVCSCILDNFKSIGLDYEKEIRDIKKDLVDNKIIKPNIESIVEQLEQIKQHGYIKETRRIENILIEQTGIKTIHFCVLIHTYKSSLDEVPIEYKMFREIEALGCSDKKIDLKRLRKQLATILLNYYKPEHKESELWNYILIQYLYILSETEMMRDIENFRSFDSIQEDTTNTVRLYINNNGDVFVNEEKILNEHLCDSLNPFLENGKGILYKYERDTNYGDYIEVYNAIKECNTGIRNKKATELYKKNYSNLTKDQRDRIKELTELRIIEIGLK